MGLYEVPLSMSLLGSMFIGYVNKLNSKFGQLQPKVLLNLLIYIVVLFMDSLHGGYIRMVLISV